MLASSSEFRVLKFLQSNEPDSTLELEGNHQNEIFTTIEGNDHFHIS